MLKGGSQELSRWKLESGLDVASVRCLPDSPRNISSSLELKGGNTPQRGLAEATLLGTNTMERV